MTESQYPHRFINQYARIPPQISDRLDAEFPAEYEGVRRCLGMIITNLLGYGPVAYSRRGNFYTEHRTEHYTRANMLRAVDIAVVKGYAEDRRGFRSEGYSRGISSILVPTAKLRRDFRPISKVDIDVTLLPLLIVDGRQVFSLDDVVSIFPASAILMPHLPTTYGATYGLNRGYFNKMRIGYDNLRLEGEYLEAIGLTRVFKGGEVGRWFQKGGLSYQGLSEEDRSKLLLNGEIVVELDYPAMHPHILYAWEDMQCPNDFYERIASECRCSRFLAKSVTLAAINASSYANLSSAINLNRAQESKANESREKPKPIIYDELKKSDLKPRDITDAFAKVHPAIAKYLFSGSANRLMLVESEIVTSALLRLMELGIPALPVHDSIIAPIRHRDTVRLAMEDAYRQHTGFSITVE